MRQRKIPTIVGLLLVLGIVFLFRTAFDRIGPLLSRAGATDAPHDIVFTNISDTTLTVTWLTSNDATGAVTVDGSKPGSTVFDERDSLPTKTTAPGKYRTHSVSLRNLSPSTEYSVRIVSNGREYLNNGLPYSVRTGPPLSGATDLEPAYGQVSYPDGNPAEGAIVFLKPEGGQTLSALVSATGSWVIPLNRVRGEDLTSLLPYAERINERIVIRSRDGDSTADTDSVNDNPVPDMIIGKTYDFKKIRAEASPAATRTLAVNPTPTTRPPVLGAATVTAVAITKPANGSAVSSDVPLIQGTGVPNQQVTILLGMTNPITATVSVGGDGIWYYTPARPLSPGKQSVTITTKNADGKTVALTNGFEVLKSGTQVLGDATPSATLIPTPTDISTVPEETPTPTATLAGEPIPTTGNPLPLILLVAAGLLLVGGGLLSVL